MEIPLQSVAFVVFALLANEINALPCYMGKEPDPDSHNKHRWVIPIEDPCQCTKVQMGSVNTRTPCRPFKVTYYDSLLLSDDPVEIRKLLNCTEGGDKDDKLCGNPLGMEDGSIPDSSITASSTHWDCPLSNGRLNHLGDADNAGGWCADIGERNGPWFQVDLGKQTLVEGVIIQGSYYMYKDETERVTAYQVQYSDDETYWQYVTDDTDVNDAQTFPGNSDQTTPVTSMFTKPIHARYVRIRPTAYNDWPSMRIELIGCKDFRNVPEQELEMGAPSGK